MTDTQTAPTPTALRPEELTGDYTIDAAHSRLGFVARHAMVTKVRGSFGEFAGTAHLDFADPTRSTAEVSLEVASIDTKQEQRDEHLRTSDFFDAPRFPQITFRSTRTEVVGDDVYRLTGDLTIKDTTAPISIDFAYAGAARDPYGNIRVGFEGSVGIRRSEWGITWNAALETGGVMVSDKITLEFDISAVRNG